MTTCTISDCGGKAIGRGLCWAHYVRQRRGQDLSPPIKRRDGRKGLVCKAEGCGRLVAPKGARGYCTKHYARLRTGIPMDYAPEKEKRCSAPVDGGCDRLVHALGLCLAHYRRQEFGKRIDTPIRKHTKRSEQQ